MKSKYTRYTEDIVERIACDIEENRFLSASEASQNYGLDTSGLIKHIKKYRVLKMTNDINKCGRKYECNHNNICEKCFYKARLNITKKCNHCKKGCNSICKNFIKIPTCQRLKKYPYVCNGCEKKNRCHLNKFVYYSDQVFKEMKKNRSESRVGRHADEKEFIRLSNLLTPLIKEKHQSLYQIYLTHKDEIKWSYPTLLSFINDRLIPNIMNCDLTKRMRYPSSYKKRKNEATNKAFLDGRTYDNFVSFITENKDVDVVEMDTVLSERGDNSCLLTLLFRKTNYFLAFLLPSKTIENVNKVFKLIKEKLGSDIYKKAFKCILTDNGSEFANPIEIEYINGVKECNLFYCNPGNSQQKGKIEKNHVELRKIFPKGTSFSSFTQDDINLALCHINSEPRAILNKLSPGLLATALLSPEILKLNGFKLIEPDEVNLHPSLVKKK